MAFILQIVNSTVQKEIAFNSYCREMAKNNVSLAYRRMNLIKTPLLLLRAPLLYLPLTNRVTQISSTFSIPTTSC